MKGLKYHTETYGQASGLMQAPLFSDSSLHEHREDPDHSCTETSIIKP